MSGAVTPRSTGPKVMTNRLMNMKFMQRAAASSPLSSTPGQTPDHQHSSKRQKLSNGTATPTSTGTSTPIPTAADDLSPHVPWNTAGETQWVLNVTKPPNNHHVNPTSSSDEDELWSASRPIGRQSYGSFKRRKTANPIPSTGTPNKENDAELSDLDSSDSDTDSEEEDEEEEDTHPLRPLKHAQPPHQPLTRESDDPDAQGARMDAMKLTGRMKLSGRSSQERKLLQDPQAMRRREKDIREKRAKRIEGKLVANAERKIVGVDLPRNQHKKAKKRKTV